MLRRVFAAWRSAMKKHIAVLGGDLRQAAVGEYFAKKDYDVLMWGFDRGIEPNDITVCKDINDAVRGAAAVILPVPALADGFINAPFSDERVPLDDISFEPDAPVFGGRLDQAALDKFDAMGVKAYDYLLCEDLAVKNAVPTAEGAIELAMSELCVTLTSCRILVMGWGRIGKILSKMLRGLGADTTVYARRSEARALCSALGYDTLSDFELLANLGSFDVIFNTVPSIMLDRRRLSRVRDDTLIIDLASKPGGISMDDARDMGKRVIWALSLPGKCAPVTSGHIIAETVLGLLKGGDFDGFKG